MPKQYTKVIFAPQYANETNEQRYTRLFNEFRNKSMARFALLAESNQQQALNYKERVAAYGKQDTTDKITNLFQAISFCKKRCFSKQHEHMLNEILARLTIACDEPENMENLQQLSLLTQEIPNREIHWHTLKYFLAPILTVGVALAILIPLASLPALAVLGIAMGVSLLGSLAATYELGQLGFKSSLQRTQKEINGIGFFATGMPKGPEAPLSDEQHTYVPACA